MKNTSSSNLSLVRARTHARTAGENLLCMFYNRATVALPQSHGSVCPQALAFWEEDSVLQFLSHVSHACKVSVQFILDSSF